MRKNTPITRLLPVPVVDFFSKLSGNLQSIDRIPLVLSISNKVRTLLSDKVGVKSIVVNNGIKTDRFKQRSNDYAGGKFRIVQVSRLDHEKKGQDLLIKAIGNMRNRDNVDVDFIGDGESFDYLNQMVHESTPIFDALAMVSRYRLSLLPVVNEKNEYKGAVVCERLVYALSELCNVEAEGSVIVLEIMKKVRTESGVEKEIKEPDFSCGYITVIENQFGYKQKLPLVMGDNLIGRRNRDTDGVNVAIITSDPSVDRKHCIINVKENKQGKLIYTLRDFPSITGTFLGNVLLRDKEQVQISEDAVVTIGATTFILHTTSEE